MCVFVFHCACYLLGNVLHDEEGYIDRLVPDEGALRLVR